MKKTLFLLLIMSMVCQIASSEPKYGKVSIDELTMSSYAQDTTAAAVILFKEAYMDFVYEEQTGFQYQYNLKMKIKILKNEGLDWCDQQIPFYDAGLGRREKITTLSGTTYNLVDGKIVKTKMSKANIFDESVNEKSNIRKFTLPGAKVGSIIEYNFTIISDYYFDLRDFYFQSSIPTEYVRFEVMIPEYFQYNLNMQGYATIDGTKTDENMKFNIRYTDSNGRLQSNLHSCNAVKYKFVGENVPAIKKEGYLWTIKDYVSKVSFELSQTRFPGSVIKSYTSSWESVDKEIFDSKLFGNNLKKTGLFKNEVPKQEATLQNATEILEMIKTRVKWNEKNSFYSDNIGDALKTGTGNSADMNFLLYNALKAGGFEAYPVILSTRGNGRIPVSHPSISAFDYVMVGLQVDTTMYFTDAASLYGSWDVLPNKCMVSQARIMNPTGSSSWVDLTGTTKGSTIIMANYKFEDDKYTGKIQRVYREGDALSFKNSYSDHKDKEEYIEKLSTKTGSDITDFELMGAEEAGVSVNNTLVQVIPEVMLGDEFIYLNPLFDKHVNENPFKSEKRDMPVMFNSLSNYRQMVTIEIPEGYEIEELPKSERIICGDDVLTLSYVINQKDNKIVLNYQFFVRDLIVLPTEYVVLQDFFAKAAAKSSEQVVLKKKI